MCILFGMKKPSALIDTVLTFAALFLLCAVVVGYFSRKTSVVLLTAFPIALGITFFAGLLAGKRRAPKARRKQLENLRNKFLFSPPEYAFSFVRETLAHKGEPTEKDGLLLCGATAFCVCLTAEKISLAQLANRYAAAHAAGARKLVFLSAYGAEADAESTAPQLQSPEVQIFDWESTYRFFVALKHPPTETFRLSSPRKTRGITGALKRENSRKYLFAAIVLLFGARFMPYAPLYAVFAALCIVLAVLCRLPFFKKSKR